MKFKIGDIFIFAFILLFSFLIICFKNEEGKIAVLKVNGQTIKTFNLHTNEVYEYSGRYYNKIIVENGTICVSESDCPDNTCVHMKKISKQGQMISCLPNGLAIEIVSGNDKVDVVSG